jgi:KipI family sensor histidine kinase inhibitor
MRFLPAGPNAVLVELDDSQAALALQAEVFRRRDQGWAPSLIDVVPGAQTVLLDGIDPTRAERELPSWIIPPAPPNTDDIIEIGCRYDGPDLADIAQQWHVTARQAVNIHTSIVHSVAFCGFGPGFAYIAGIGPSRVVARRRSPRTTVPAGSVALGGVYTGIYPRPSPGGWQLMGRTDTVLWDTGREPAALLQPGRRVRFVDLGS